jgi:hypothetical protein
VARLRADPHGFLDAARTPAILDEVQNVPEVFAFVRSRIDRRPRRTGQWLLTGSQEAPLMQGVSAAGRVHRTARLRHRQGRRPPRLLDPGRRRSRQGVEFYEAKALDVLSS